MTHAVAAWPPEPALGCCGGVRRPHVCLPRVSATVSAIPSCRAHRARCRCMCVGLELHHKWGGRVIRWKSP
eukprot:2179357-Prymnesium_polylepis.1